MMPHFEWVALALGSISKVRILGHLCHHPDRWQSEAEISRAIGMSPNTVNLAVRDLMKTGALESQAAGRVRRTRLREGSTQAGALRQLFESERALLDRLKEIVGPLVGPGASVILFGSAARGDRLPPADMDLLIVAPTKDRAAALDIEITKAARVLHPGPWRAIHLTRSDVRRRWGSSLIESIRREGVLLAGRPLEAYR